MWLLSTSLNWKPNKSVTPNLNCIQKNYLSPKHELKLQKKKLLLSITLNYIKAYWIKNPTKDDLGKTWAQENLSNYVLTWSFMLEGM